MTTITDAMDIDALSESPPHQPSVSGHEREHSVHARTLFDCTQVRKVVSEADKDLAKLGMKNRCPKGIGRSVLIMYSHDLIIFFCSEFMAKAIQVRVFNTCNCTDGCKGKTKCPCKKRGDFCQSHDCEMPLEEVATAICQCSNCVNLYQNWTGVKVGKSSIEGEGLFAEKKFLR